MSNGSGTVIGEENRNMGPFVNKYNRKDGGKEEESYGFGTGIS